MTKYLQTGKLLSASVLFFNVTLCYLNFMVDKDGTSLYSLCIEKLIIHRVSFELKEKYTIVYFYIEVYNTISIKTIFNIFLHTMW